MGTMGSIARSVRASAVAGLLLLSTPAWAQEASGIAGVVRDTSGAVLPGVTVEAASPALIEKVRSVVTDGEGRYNIVDLRPGTYTVTFSLTGFRTVQREGIQLPTGFTATVNGDLSVGALEETITVSGAVPLVDTQNVRKQTVASRELLDTLPTSTKRVDTLVTLTPGFTGVADVGGRYNSEPGSYHGKRGTKQYFDGMGVENSSGNSSYQINAATIEEMVLQTSGISAEVNADGPVMNVIPKEGSNTFRTILNGVFSNNKMESDNLSDELRARGLETGNKTVKIFDESISVGGPIQQDRLWFFGAFRTWGMARQFAGVYWNKTQNELLSPPGAPLEVVKLTPWVDRPLDRLSSRWEWYDSPAGRVTWQATPRNKVNFFMDYQIACNCGSTSSSNLQEVSNGYRFEPNMFMQLTWNSPVTSRLLLEAGIGASISQWNQYRATGVQENTIAITDQGSGLSYGAATQYRGHPNYTNRKSQRFSATYVTGSHTMKTGVQVEELFTDNFINANGNLSYTFRNGVPQSITQRTTPYLEQEGAREFGMFAQDQWRVSRWTFNYGVRFDYFYGFAPAQHLPGTPRDKFDDRFPGALRTNAWVGERSFDKVTGIPSWKDISPRLGTSWDVFGNGRTALKASIGRYVAKTGTDLTRELNPITTSVNAANRAWADANQNYFPDCDLGNFAANGECGALNNLNFGQNNPNATRWQDAVLEGWGVRDNNWEVSTEVQHEITRELSLTAGYYRNNGGYFRERDSKQRVNDNILVGPADYDTYCITAPSDPRLPGGGGYQVCGLADIRPSKFGQVENVTKPTSEFGTDKRVNHFLAVGLTARLPNGARVSGGFDTGRSVSDQCFVVDAPGLVAVTTATSNFSQIAVGTATTIDGQPLCRVVTPFKAQTQVKVNGSFPLPMGFVVSGVYQDLAGTAIAANYAATTAEIAPSLGRPLAGGTRSVNVSLIAPQTLFEDRTRRLDLRLTKNFQLTPRLRLQANLDAYNALNSNAVQSVNTTYGANWLTPTTILDPRILQISFQLTF
ncbi:MAG: hypothetical protein GEU82_05010 [Luteitalea sp.]|nr:hypothetical protein [Luteitalea sp.]